LSCKFYAHRFDQTSDSDVGTFEKPSFLIHDDEENLSKVSQKQKKSNSLHDNEDEVMAKQRKETGSEHVTVDLDTEKPELGISEIDVAYDDGVSLVELCDLETSLTEIIYESEPSDEIFEIISDDGHDAPLNFDDIEMLLASSPESDSENDEGPIGMETEEEYHVPETEVTDNFS
jgi:hypothetical protein